MKKLNGLSIDGGGIRGLIVAVQLEQLEKDLGAPIKNSFNYLGLNSTSGILGVLLALGYSATDLVHFYLNHGPEIFDKKPFRWFGLLKPRYDKEYFNNILEELVGNKKLSDLDINIVVSATNYSNRYDKNLVYLFKSEKARQDPSRDFYLKDVIKATTAAPTYFAPEEVTSVDGKTTFLFADGGLCVNNPSHMMFIEMCKNDKTCTKNVLSFSTGKKIPSSAQRIKNLNDLKTKGSISNVDDFIDIQLDANQYIADYNMEFAQMENRLQCYYRLKSYIVQSDGSIDNASKINMKNMLEDGKFSYNVNKLLIKNFIENM